MTTAPSQSTPRADLDIDTLTSWLLDNVARILEIKRDEIEVQAELTEYGMDSRQFIELTMDLEELLGRELPTTLLWDNPSIAALAATLLAPAP
jgi:phthiocerol/phenolphthiocerol synthesis type-I polyketide synthase D